MPVRRLQLDYSDDDDKDDQQTPAESVPLPPRQLEMEHELQHQVAPVTHQPPTLNPQNPTHYPPEPLEISSDGDFIDVSDNLSTPSPPPPQNAEHPPNGPYDAGCPVSDSLRRLGLSLKSEWLGACIRKLENSVPGFSGFDVSTKAKLCFEQFLLSDMNDSGGGVLPANVASMHLVDLSGPYVLQIDEIINISCPLRTRYQQAPPGLKRCLKLSMTDGVQRVFGMEYRPNHALEVCASAGLKVVISNVHVRHGLLMLVPETIEILGGLVEQLDAARKRLVDELNKPPRGKSVYTGLMSEMILDMKRAGLNATFSLPELVHKLVSSSSCRTRNGALPPLPARATLAAWPSNGVDNPGLHNSTVQSSDPIPANNRGNLGLSVTDNSLTTEGTLPIFVPDTASNSIPNVVLNVEAMHIDTHRDTNPVPYANIMANRFSPTIASAGEMLVNSPNVIRANSVCNESSLTVSNIPDASADEIYISRQNTVAHQSAAVAQNVEETDRDDIPVNRVDALVNRSSSPISIIDDSHMVDASDHPLILSGDREVPFTYLASLSAKWAAVKEKEPSVQGIIKCFLTGVKGFQYKQRTKYELQAYIDDGSLISEILIEHNVVQKGIGYSPAQVTAALSSSDTKIARNMKETLRKFQAFLANFEGVMLVELNEKFSLPLVLEMNHGCPRSDARLLLRRLKPLIPAQVQKHCPSDPIELSP